MDIMTDRVRGRLWTIDTNGQNHRPLLDDSIAASGATWSPDGTRIPFVSNSDGDSDIFTMRRDGTAQERITATDEDDESPDW